MKSLTPLFARELSPPTSPKIPIVLVIRGQQVPSFKNRKIAIVLNRKALVNPQARAITRTLTEPKTKARMDLLENAILSALYSSCPTIAGVTAMEWQKQLRIALSGLLDDSFQIIPESSWRAEKVAKGQEGVRIEIIELAD